MRTLILMLALAPALAGCSMSAGESENAPPPDKGGYSGGPGIALAAANEGTGTFWTVVRVLGAGGAEVARLDVPLDAGERVEKWWSLEHRGTYAVRMSYSWQDRPGQSNGGADERAVDLNTCPKVTRAAWTFRQINETVGSEFVGPTCIE